MGLDTLDRFLPSFTRKTTFVTFCFPSCVWLFWKGVSQKGCWAQWLTGWAFKWWSRGCQFDLTLSVSATFFHGDWSWNTFYGHSLILLIQWTMFLGNRQVGTFAYCEHTSVCIYKFHENHIIIPDLNSCFYGKSRNSLWWKCLQNKFHYRTIRHITVRGVLF